MNKNINKKILLSLLIITSLISCRNNETSSNNYSSDDVSYNSSNNNSQNSEDNKEFYFEGIEDISILQGTFFSPLKDVCVYNKYGDNVTNKINVKGTVDYGIPGTYEVIYSIESFTKKRKITVIENDEYDKKEEVKIYESNELYVISTNCDVYGNYKDNNYCNNMTDGDVSTRYESIWEEKVSSFVIDLKAILSFEKIEINWEAASAKKYNIYVSDDNINYTHFKTFSGNYGSRIDVINVNSMGRYIKFELNEKWMESYGYSIYEVSIYGYRGSSIPKNMYPELFSSNSIEDEQYFEIDLNGNYDINKSNLSFYDLSPISYSIEIFTSSWIEIYKGDYASYTFDDTYNISKIRFNFHYRRFNSYCYKISQIELYNGEDKLSLDKANFSASSYKEGHEVINAKDNWSTYWASDYNDENKDYLIIDLKSIKSVGKIQILFNQNYGKIFDIDISNDGVNYNTLIRELHGATRLQEYVIKRETRFIRIKDYSSNFTYHKIENIVIDSMNPYDEIIDYVIGDLPVINSINVNKGSYAQDDYSFPTARYIAYDNSSRSGATPSNGIWQSLLINNFGNAMYFYPLRAKYSDLGLGISYPGEGYFETTYNRSQTVTDTIDLYLKPYEKLSSPITNIIDDSDMTVGVSFSDNEVMKMVNYFSQGNPYISSYFASKKALISFNNVTKITTLDGNEISLNQEYIGSNILVSISSLSKYENSNGVNEKVYEDRLYLISVNDNSNFKYTVEGLVIDLSTNYLSIVNVNDKTDIDKYVASSGASVLSSYVSNDVIDDKDVKTTYSYEYINEIDNSDKPLIGVLPHQRKKIIDTNLTNLTPYKSVRGDIYLVNDNKFITNDKFYGISPTYDEPIDSSYSREVMISYLEKLDIDTSNNIMSEDAYWQGKSLHPLANGAMEAHQLGLYDLRDKFVSRLKEILTDWYTYDGINDKYYFYYDNEWGTLYYRVSEFGANYNLADHHFTYGYYVFASMVAFRFDKEFKSNYQDMVNLLLMDYMNYTSDTSLFDKFRNYDYYAGHSWAGGYADSDGGNNQESASESLNSYQAAYLYAELIEDQDLKDASIYCYTTELSAIKQYWFNYDNDSYSSSYPYHGVGQIYGGSNFYGTFFNGDPTYIYGIHLLPSGEYLTSYSLGKEENEKLKSLYEDYVKEEINWTNHDAEDGYQHIYWVILAMFDSDAALNRLEKRIDEIKNSNELFNVYYLIHSLNSLGVRSKEIQGVGLPSTTYEKDGKITTVVTNLTDKEKTIRLYNGDNQVSTYVIAPNTTFHIDPYKNGKINNSIEENEKVNLGYANYVDDNNYTFTFIFNEKGEYVFNISLVNESNITFYIYIKDERGNIIDKILVPADDNLIITSNKLVLYGKRNITFEIDSALIINEIYYTK